MMKGAGPGRLNSTRFASGESFASSSAWRSVPGPASFVLVTVTCKRYGITRMVKVQVLVLPEWSTAVQVTVLVRTGKTEPEGGAQETCGLASQTSATVGEGKVTVE